MCRATGNPKPQLSLTLSGHCPHTVDYTSHDTYTAQAVISMQVMMECKMIYCATNSNYNPLLEIIPLNITSELTFEHDSAERITILSVRNTTVSPPDTNPTNGSPVNGTATSFTYSVSLLIWMTTVALLLTGIR